MPGGFEYLQRVIFSGRQVRISLAWQLYAEPLTRQCLAILETCIADCAQGNTGRLGDTPCRLFGVQTTLFKPQPQVLAVYGQRYVQHLSYLKIFSRGFEHCRA